MLNASQYAAYSNDMLSAAGQTTNPLWADPSSLTSSTDWLDEMFRTGLSQIIQLVTLEGMKSLIIMFLVDF